MVCAAVVFTSLHMKVVVAVVDAEVKFGKIYLRAKVAFVAFSFTLAIYTKQFCLFNTRKNIFIELEASKKRSHNPLAFFPIILMRFCYHNCLRLINKYHQHHHYKLSFSLLKRIIGLVNHHTNPFSTPSM